LIQIHQGPYREFSDGRTILFIQIVISDADVDQLADSGSFDSFIDRLVVI